MATTITTEGWTKTILREGDGKDQGGVTHGFPQPNDWVKIQYKGKVVSTGKEFEDTYHRDQPVHFQIIEAGPTATPISWTKGLAEAAQHMLLGEKCEVTIKSEYAYGNAGMKAQYGKVPPNEDVILKCELYQINTHRRAKPKDTTCCFWKVLYCFTRAY